MRRSRNLFGAATVPRPDAAMFAAIMLLALTVAIIVAVPAALRRAGDDELTRRLAASAPQDIGLEVKTVLPLHLLDKDDPFTVPLLDWDEDGDPNQPDLPLPFRVDAPHTTTIELPRLLVNKVNGTQPVFPTGIGLRTYEGIEDHAVVAASSGPLVSLTGDDAERELPIVDVAITQQTADAIRIAVGDELEVRADPEDRLVRAYESAGPQVVLRIAEIVELSDPSASFWWGDERLHRPVIDDTIDGAEISATFLLRSPNLFTSPWARRGGVVGTVIERQPLGFTTANVAQSMQWLNDVRRVEANTPDLPRLGQQVAGTRIGVLVDELVFRRAESARSFRALLVLELVLLALALWRMAFYSAHNRRESISVLRARGGSSSQLVAGAFFTGALVAIAAGLLGVLISFSTSSAVRAGFVAPANVAASAVVLVVAGLTIAALTWARTRVPLIDELETRERSPGQLQRLLDVAVLVVAAVAILSLRNRTVTVGTELVTIITIAAMALSAGVIGRRVLEAIADRPRLRTLNPGLSLRRIGAGSSLAPAMIDVLVLGIIVFAAALVVNSSVDQAIEEAAWDEIGAPIRVEAWLGQGVAAADAAGIRGVDAVSSEAVVRGATLEIGDQPSQASTLVLVDAPSAAVVVSSDPSQPFGDVTDWSRRPRIPVLVPQDGRLGGVAVGTTIDGVAAFDQLDMVVVGQHSARQVDRQAIIIDRGHFVDALGWAPSPHSLLLSGTPDVDDLLAIPTAARVLTRDDVVQRLSSQAQTATLVQAARLIAGLTALCIIAVCALMARVIATARREQSALLAALGVRPRRLGRFAGSELLLSLGAGLVAAVGAAVTIAAVIGGRFQPALLVLGRDATARTSLAESALSATIGAVALVALGAGLGWVAIRLSMARSSHDQSRLLRRAER